MADICVVDKTPIKTMCFKGTGVCCELCRKIRDGEIPCSYEDRWCEDIGDLPVCVVHNANSKYSEEEGEHRPCIEVEPWSIPD